MMKTYKKKIAKSSFISYHIGRKEGREENEKQKHHGEI